MEGEKSLYLCSHGKYWASGWEQGLEKGFQQLQSRSSSWEVKMGLLSAAPMVQRRKWPSLMSRESPRGDTPGLERQITEPMQTHEAAPHVFGEMVMPVPCNARVCSLSLSLCACPARVM